MTIFIKKITLCLMLLGVSASLYAQSILTLTPSTNNVNPPTPPIETDKPDPNDIPRPGNRIPVLRIIGYIDWDSRQFTLSTSENIILFEVWDDESCLFTSSTPATFIDFLLLSNNGQLTIAIYTPEHKFIGIYQD